eukprot:gnl/TRDRNA2_/TRDRNA2_175916_c7_seq1.p1 gnl/TRDRNA2_/TRDRNA2_175916_c7~~gnl/TRDRNA2_/TRDRNA2_175916_c7_seq1.p1  ORF type:complete len:220 (+),score=22.38 gnl/TRDRNA2_/TRDRNA2_175916_c7_seq1:94-753(+)
MSAEDARHRVRKRRRAEIESAITGSWENTALSAESMTIRSLQIIREDDALVCTWTDVNYVEFTDFLNGDENGNNTFNLFSEDPETGWYDTATLVYNSADDKIRVTSWKPWEPPSLDLFERTATEAASDSVGKRSLEQVKVAVRKVRKKQAELDRELNRLQSLLPAMGFAAPGTPTGPPAGLRSPTRFSAATGFAPATPTGLRSPTGIAPGTPTGLLTPA